MVALIQGRSLELYYQNF